MGGQHFVFEGLSDIEDRIRRLASDIAYLTVSDRTDRSREEQLGRFDFEVHDALPYLQQHDDEQRAAEPSLYDDEDDESLAFEEEPGDEDEADRERTPEDIASIAEAGCRWLRDIARRNTVGEPYRRFRVKAYAVKGLRVVDTASFVCKNVDYDLELPLLAGHEAREPPPELRIPTPSFEESAAQGASRGFRALGDFYAQWGQIVLGAVGQLQGVNNAVLARTHRQLEESRSQVDQLIAAVLEFRMAELRVGEERRSDERTEEARAELAKHALQQLGEATRAFLATRGVPSELADIVGVLGQSPSLMSALAEPEVRELVRDPQNLEMLAGLLRQAGQQARMLREAAVGQHPNP